MEADAQVQCTMTATLGPAPNTFVFAEGFGYSRQVGTDVPAVVGATMDHDDDGSWGSVY
jgi:hypothetical protein